MNTIVGDQGVARVQKAYGMKLAEKALELEAVRLSPTQPFTWASGFKMPIYNDNRRFLSDAFSRKMIAEAFEAMLEAVGFVPDGIAGTATAGIPHATTLADRMGLPLSYVRQSGKDHGLRNTIEGLGSDGSYHRKRILLVEDLISTGGSSIAAVQAIAEAHGEVPYCFAIFSYALEESTKAFAMLEPSCTPIPIMQYDMLVDVAVSSGYIGAESRESLRQWRNDPFGWGTAHGFPPVSKR